MFTDKIYVPSDMKSTFDSFSCHIIRNNKIYSYNVDTCSNSSCVLHTLVLDQKHYQYQYEDLILSTDNYSNYMTACTYDTYTTYTTDIYYRNDIDSILCIFFILLLIMFYFPYRIISRMFGRWFKW